MENTSSSSMMWEDKIAPRLNATVGVEQNASQVSTAVRLDVFSFPASQRKRKDSLYLCVLCVFSELNERAVHTIERCPCGVQSNPVILVFT